MNTFKLNPVLGAVRKQYTRSFLSEETVLENPFHQFEAWLEEAFEEGNEFANAMVLSTVDQDLMPSSRIVLLRNISYGGFTFYTNYQSKKGFELEQNNNASLLFFWQDMERQVRIEGITSKLPEKESDDYFESRPFESKVGALVSRQSHIIDGRNALEETYTRELKKYENKKVPRPHYWGGYVLRPSRFEFWQGRDNRLHDRIQYRRKANSETWIKERLMP